MIRAEGASMMVCVGDRLGLYRALADAGERGLAPWFRSL